MKILVVWMNSGVEFIYSAGTRFVNCLGSCALDGSKPNP